MDRGGSGPADLETLATAVQTQTGRYGFEPEERNFRPHMTVGRLEAPADVTSVITSLDVAPVRMTVERITLFRSHNGYEPVDTFPLRS